MSYHILMKLVVTITILAVAFAPFNQLLSELFRNVFQTENHVERKESLVVKNDGSLAYLKKLQDMEDGRINSNPEANHLRTRRDISSQKTPSSVNKDSCGTAGAPGKLADVQILVDEETNTLRAIEKEFLKLLKEKMEFAMKAKESSPESSVTADIEVLRRVLKKTEDDGDALLKSQEQKTNVEILKLKTQLDANSLEKNINTAKINELELKIRLNLHNLNVDLKQQIENAENGFKAAEEANKGEKEKYENCEKVTDPLRKKDIASYDAESIKNEIIANKDMTDNCGK